MNNGSKQVIKNEVLPYISDEAIKLRLECFPDMQGENALRINLILAVSILPLK